MAVAAPVMNGMRARVAAAAVPLRTQLEKAETTWGVRAWQVAAFAATLIPLVGLGATYLIDRHKNAVVADNKKEVLAKHYKSQIAAVVGVPSDKVTKKDLQLAAGNPAIAQAVKKVNEEQASANRGAAFALGGAAALSSFIPLPGAGTVAHTVSKLAVDATGAIAGGAVSSMFDKDILEAHDVIVHLNDKQVAGQAITAEDIMMLRIAQNEQLQAALKKQNGKAFHKMIPEQQRAVIVSLPNMPGVPSIEEAGQLAGKINANVITIEEAMMMTPAKTNSWADRVGGSRGSRGSFVGKLNAERAAAAQGFVQGA